MMEKWHKNVDKDFGTLLSDLSKAFDCVHVSLLIDKLHAQGFDMKLSNLIYKYLSK